MSYPIFIDPLPRHFTSADLAELLRPFGRVEMQTNEEADNACKGLHGTAFRNGTLTVLQADEVKTDLPDRHLISTSGF